MKLRQLNLVCIGNGGLVVCDGTELSHRFLVDFLKELGELVRAIRFVGWAEVEADPLSLVAIRGHGVTACGISPIRGCRLQMVRNAVRAILKVLTSTYNADFVYIFLPGKIGLIFVAAARLAGKPYGVYLRGQPSAVHFPLRLALSGANFCLTTGDSLREIATRFCKYVELVSPMTQLRHEHISWPRHPKKGGGAFRVLYVGRVEASKGVFELIKAVPLLRRLKRKVELVLVGHCHDKDQLDACLSPEVRPLVMLRGAIGDFKQLADEYLRADLFVLPSHAEGFPRVLYEAMTFRLPILTTFVGGISSVMNDGVNCLRINTCDPADIAEKIEKIACDEELQTSLANAGVGTILPLINLWQKSHAMQITERLRLGLEYRVL